MRKSLLITYLLATSFLACGVAAMNNVSAKAETADFATAFGASVRVSEPNGIRFKLQLSENKKNEIFAENSIPTVAYHHGTGASDAVYTTLAGIPTVDSIGPIGAGVHTVNESMILETFAESAKRMAAVIYSI